MEALRARIAPHFARAEPRRHALAYLAGLLSPLTRKTSWQLAARAGDLRPDGMQRLLTSAVWDADRVRDEVRAYALEHLADANAVLLVGELGFPKKGYRSVGVAPQYNAAAGRSEHCQVGVFLAYAGPRGCALIDRELYLPAAWLEHADRRLTARIPADVVFATKPQLAQRMLARALAARVPAAWVVGDAVYGGDAGLRRWLEDHELAYVLAVANTEVVWLDQDGRPEQAQIGDVGARLADACWQPLRAGPAGQEPSPFDWARLPLARPPTGPDGETWGRWVLARRDIAEAGATACYLAFGPAESSLEALAGAAERRADLDACFALARRDVGLDHYEVRHWRAWYRHITLAMLAQAHLVASRPARGRVAGERGRLTAVVGARKCGTGTPGTHLASPIAVGGPRGRPGSKEVTMVEEQQQGLTLAELDAQDATELPERDEMSLINANVAAPINLAVALNVLSDGSVAYANAVQTAPITQSTP